MLYFNTVLKSRECMQVLWNTKRSPKEFLGWRKPYLQEDGPSWDAELDTVFGGIVPRQQLQVLYSAVGQSRLHVTCGLERRGRRGEKKKHFKTPAKSVNTVKQVHHVITHFIIYLKWHLKKIKYK